MKKIPIVILTLIAFITMSFVVINETAPVYKNLKILPKNITKTQLDSVMHSFKDALGVKCSYCHVYNEDQKSMDFASDAKEEKNTARYMWRMMGKINKKYFEVKNSKTIQAKLEVTCFTCHHGEHHPETKPLPENKPQTTTPRG